MTKFLKNDKYEIVYNESVWTGSKLIKVNGVVLQKISKNYYQAYIEGEEIKATISGNVLKGQSLNVNGTTFIVSLPPLWYEYVLAIFPVVFILIWGNIPALCMILPVIGGAIGGGIAGLFMVLSIVFMKKTDKPLFKVLIGFGMMILSILVCTLLGIAFLSLFA